MPIYVYHCPQCNEEIDKLKPMAEMDSLEKCPKCGTEMKRKPTCGMFKMNGATPKFHQ